MFRVRLGRLFGVTLGVDVVRMGKMRMMAGVCVLAFLMMFGGLAMMLGGFVVVLGGAFRVLHNRTPRCEQALTRGDCARIGRRIREAFTSY